MRLEHLAAVERQRHRFFLGHIGPHVYVGGLRDPALLAELGAHRIPGRREDPLSATRLESYAACPFSFFLKSVLRAREREEVDDEIDERALGLLTHQVLERLFRRFVEGGLLPLTGKEEERDLAEEVCDEIVAEWRATEALGHPGLFAVKERRMRQEIAALLAAEVDSPPSPDCRPAYFERPFGPMAFGDVWLKGKIDRIDLGTERAVVLDYKTGRKTTYTSQLADEALCVTAWQLPIYAAVVKSELSLPHVEAAFYSLRDAQVTRAVPSPDTLPQRLEEVHASMRAGSFMVAPRQDACERCGMEAACRVRHLSRAEDEP
jgi:ATP-dependent helicase/nuclease subunit B